MLITRCKTIYSQVKAEGKELCRRSSFWIVLGVMMGLIGLDFVYVLNYTRDPNIMPVIFQDMALSLVLLSPYLIIKQIHRYTSDNRVLQLAHSVKESYWWWATQYLASLAMMGYLLLPTLLFPLILTLLGQPSWGVIVSGYLGLIVLHAVLTACIYTFMALVRSVLLIYWGMYATIGLIWIYPQSQYLIWAKLSMEMQIISVYDWVLPFFYGAIDIGTLKVVLIGTCIVMYVSARLTRRFGLIRNVFS